MEPARLSSLARLFVKLGVIGVGGPAAHVALMHDEVVRRRKWESEEDFALMVGATALVPGPNSTEVAMVIGSDHGPSGESAVRKMTLLAPLP